jgi:UDP-N-acetylglucosamine--N-acetylmuramyl-(pentapeptide) pyrophosphoryl-undecaprenol N-acetylglucosamine transferase
LRDGTVLIMKIFFVAGGTGGHVYPAIAIAEAVMVQDPTTAIAFVGRAEGMEAQLVHARGWPFHAISAAPMKALSMWRRFVGIVCACGACVAALRLLRRERPSCVIGTGGYVAGPVLLMAALLRIPTIIHEQNSIPGLTNRLLGRVVRHVCTTFAHSARFFPRRKVRETGLPLRHALLCAARESTSAPRDPITLLVMGGSQGAKPLNEAMMAAAPLIGAAAPGQHVVHMAGRHADLTALRQAYDAAGLTSDISDFRTDLEQVYPGVTLAVSRAGACSLTELALFGIPTIFVPFPAAADDHQTLNAQEVVACGGGVSLQQCMMTPENLAEHVVRLLESPERLDAMREAMRGVARPGAAALIAEMSLHV